MNDILRRKAALEAADDDRLDRVACLRDEPLLHTVAVSYEEELGIRLLFLYVARYRYGGVDVSGCTAAGK